jgi:PAS domain S-box-containing protein
LEVLTRYSELKIMAAVIPKNLQEQAFFYAAGNLTAGERVAFEAVMERDPAVMDFTREVLELATRWTLEELDWTERPSAKVKARTLAAIDSAIGIEQLLENFSGDLRDGVVLTGQDGLVRWVNRSFCLMCGYTLDELRGKKPGAVLQGPSTDPATVDRMRSAVSRGSSCCEELINYHKNGNPYRVAISINPILDSTGLPRAFVAIERELLPSGEKRQLAET